MSELATKQPGRDRVQLCMNLLLLNGALRLRWAIPPLLPPLLLLERSSNVDRRVLVEAAREVRCDAAVRPVR
jgi:hypothetical protein